MKDEYIVKLAWSPLTIERIEQLIKDINKLELWGELWNTK